MKHLLALFLLVTLQVTAQTGSLRPNVNFINDAGCATFKVELTSDSLTLHFEQVRKQDTLHEIPVGVYSVRFYSCDSTFVYGQNIEIIEDETQQLNFRNGAYVGDFDVYNNEFGEYYDSSEWSGLPPYAGLQFGRGLDYDNTSQKVRSNFNFQYVGGIDFRLGKSPIAMGFESGISYGQINYDNVDFLDTAIIYDKLRYRSFNIQAAFLTSIYIKKNKLFDIGVKYRLPIYARIARVSNNETINSKRVHQFNDLTLVAHLGYAWGFIFAEYQLNSVLIAPYENAPRLMLGVRLNAPTY